MKKLIILFLVLIAGLAKAQSVCNPLPTNYPNYTITQNFTGTAPPAGDKKYYTQNTAQIVAAQPITSTGIKRFYSTNRISLTSGFKASSSGATTKFVAAIVTDCASPITKQTEENPKENITSETQGITIYPNPTITTLNIAYNNVAVTSFIITDVTGRQLWQQTTDASQVDNVNVTGFPKGVYTIIFIGNNFTQSFKFIKNE